jgi:8-oxo-dGTP pyrophosphatase MutT (NUDIX family)
MVPGGHVEIDETPAEAAVREVSEETGLTGVRFLQPPAPRLPAGFPHERVEPPWWIIEMRVPSDSHLAEPHVHVDHEYLALVNEADPVAVPAHPFGWYGDSDLQGLEMPEDTKLLAKMVFEVIDDLACARPGAASSLLHVPA